VGVDLMSKGHENLIPLNQLTKEEQREICSKGGKASVQKRKEKKLLKDTIMEFLEAVNPDSGNSFQIDLVNSMLQKALEGDVSAFNTIRDTAGQKPKEEIQAVCMPIINIKGL
jgi:hypothetical protein